MTKRLILMRHAKSDWTMGLDDHERPLNARGRRSATGLGNWLRAEGLVPDQALVSSALRTRETFDRLGFDLGPQILPGLYLAEPEEMLAALAEATGNTVLMIGHNDGIAELAHILVATPPAHPRFADYPTGSTLVVDFDAPAWAGVTPRQGRAVAFLTPRDLE